MKIAVSSKGAGLGAWIHPDFLTCNFIVVVDESRDFLVIKNQTNRQNESDEITLAKELIDKEIGYLITGNISKTIVDFLKSNGLTVYVANEGSILELIEQAEQGSLPLFI
ncbi:MAG: NifB/NifX family molybdenum-iron cluster-binding protein [Pelolinea sp.]|nr:NifB/NifX family molybdenum-iron cluster-binding protein [Pelolinea sp.]